MDPQQSDKARDETKAWSAHIKNPAPNLAADTRAWSTAPHALAHQSSSSQLCKLSFMAALAFFVLLPFHRLFAIELTNQTGILSAALPSG